MRTGSRYLVRLWQCICRIKMITLKKMRVLAPFIAMAGLVLGKIVKVSNVAGTKWIRREGFDRFLVVLDVFTWLGLFKSSLGKYETFQTGTFAWDEVPTEKITKKISLVKISTVKEWPTI